MRGADRDRGRGRRLYLNFWLLPQALLECGLLPHALLLHFHPHRCCCWTWVRRRCRCGCGPGRGRGRGRGRELRQPGLSLYPLELIWHGCGGGWFLLSCRHDGSGWICRLPNRLASAVQLRLPSLRLAYGHTLPPLLRCTKQALPAVLALLHRRAGTERGESMPNYPLTSILRLPC